MPFTFLSGRLPQQLQPLSPYPLPPTPHVTFNFLPSCQPLHSNSHAHFNFNLSSDFHGLDLPIIPFTLLLCLSPYSSTYRHAFCLTVVLDYPTTPVTLLLCLPPYHQLLILLLCLSLDCHAFCPTVMSLTLPSCLWGGAVHGPWTAGGRMPHDLCRLACQKTETQHVHTLTQLKSSCHTLTQP